MFSFHEQHVSQFSAVAHRIVSVGAVGRAEKLATMLDKDHPVR
jgi:hypothetical protein